MLINDQSNEVIINQSQKNKKIESLAESKFFSESEKELAQYMAGKFKLLHIQLIDEERGYFSRVECLDDKVKIEVSKFLIGNFCKTREISAFVLSGSNKKDALVCEMDKSGVRKYKAWNNATVTIVINWLANGKQCSITVEIIGNKNNVVKVITHNGVTKEDLEENKSVMIEDSPLSQAVPELELQTQDSKIEGNEKIITPIPTNLTSTEIDSQRHEPNKTI